MYYILADGSGIGVAIFTAIASNDTSEAKRVSDSINRGVERIREELEKEGIEVIFAGGDDVFCMTPNDDKVKKAILIIKRVFIEETSFTMDVAIGNSPYHAAEELDRLKTKKRLEKLNG